jgi:hypothetical protein
MSGELVVLNISRREVLNAHRAAMSMGADGVLALAGELWADYVGRQILCFLCNSTCTWPPFSMILPDRDGEVMALPLCPSCTELPQMVRLHRCNKLLRKMWGIDRKSRRR